jgi:hypothetical protein
MKAQDLGRSFARLDTEQWSQVLSERLPEVSWAFERLAGLGPNPTMDALNEWMKRERNDAALLVAVQREQLIRGEMKAIHAARIARQAGDRQKFAQDRADVVKSMKRGEVQFRDPMDRIDPLIYDSLAKQLKNEARAYARNERLGERDEKWLWDKIRETHGAVIELETRVDVAVAKEMKQIDALRWGRETLNHKGASDGLLNHKGPLGNNGASAGAPGGLLSYIRDGAAFANLEEDASAVPRNVGQLAHEDRRRRTLLEAWNTDPVALKARGAALKAAHPEQNPEWWAERFGDQAVEWLAARRELEIRKEMTRRRELEAERGQPIPEQVQSQDAVLAAQAVAGTASNFGI